jgi:hypothetical protein
MWFREVVCHLLRSRYVIISLFEIIHHCRLVLILINTEMFLRVAENFKLRLQRGDKFCCWYLW